MAYAKARQLGLKSRLVLCGADFQNGELKKFCRRLDLEKEVCFTGLVTPGKARQLMRHCLFFALFSRFESFGMAPLEAMSCGKATLLSGAGGMKDFARNRRNTLLAPILDPNNAARLMLRLEREVKLRKKLEIAALKTAAAYSWPIIAGRYERFYRG
ncbi:MAG TPA: glycosyltransferase, partial [Elusimicrobiales bacterium]|nr:glycosyltransferase [Elusimicrobiales bacterium]